LLDLKNGARKIIPGPQFLGQFFPHSGEFPARKVAAVIGFLRDFSHWRFQTKSAAFGWKILLPLIYGALRRKISLCMLPARTRTQRGDF
jgi:hypothetical protein